jgi:glutaredoxin
MKISKTLLILFLLSIQLIFAQKKINLETFEAKKGTTFFIENKTNFTQKVTLIITSKYFNDGYKTIIKKIKPKKKKKIYTLKHKEKIKFTTKVENKKTATKKQLKIAAKKIAEQKFDLNNDNPNSGIVIFSKKTCSRCRFAENYLDENNIKFKKIAIDESAEGKKLMWKLIRGSSTKKMRIKTPVIVIDGKVSYSHENLVEFLKNIKS